MKKLTLFVSATLCLSVSGAYADFRIWEDKSGNRYEAEFVRELFDKMTLRTKEGRELVLPVEDFSELDQKYLRVMVPPSMIPEVLVQSVRRKKPHDEWNERDVLIDTKAIVTIQQKSNRTFTGRLTAELFLIAEELDGDNFVLMSRTESSFLLGGPKAVYRFASEPVLLIETTDYFFDYARGDRYKGYLLVVSDARGNICKTDSNMGAWIQSEEVIKNLRELMIRGAASLYIRHFDRTGKPVDVPRPRYHSPAK